VIISVLNFLPRQQSPLLLHSLRTVLLLPELPQQPSVRLLRRLPLRQRPFHPSQELPRQPSALSQQRQLFQQLPLQPFRIQPVPSLRLPAFPLLFSVQFRQRLP